MTLSDTHRRLIKAAERDVHAVSAGISIRFRLVLMFAIAVVLTGGCAADYSPRADLSTVRTIGVVVSPGLSDRRNAEDAPKSPNLSDPDEPANDSASGAGAGAGAAVGTVAGITAGALTICTGTGPLVLVCFGAFLAGGAVLGASAVAIAAEDTRAQVDIASVHRYEVSQVLPDLQRDYLASSVLRQRALRTVLAQGTGIDFVPAAWNGDRYARITAATSSPAATDVNLVLTAMSLSLDAKEKHDQTVVLNIGMQWALTKYDPVTRNDQVWDAMSASYRSRERRLSEWLNDNGALLKAEVDSGLEKSLSEAFSDLPSMAQR